LDYLTERL